MGILVGAAGRKNGLPRGSPHGEWRAPNREVDLPLNPSREGLAWPPPHAPWHPKPYRRLGAAHWPRHSWSSTPPHWDLGVLAVLWLWPQRLEPVIAYLLIRQGLPPSCP